MTVLRGIKHLSKRPRQPKLLNFGIAMFDAFKGCVVVLCDLFFTHTCLRFKNQQCVVKTLLREVCS